MLEKLHHHQQVVVETFTIFCINLAYIREMDYVESKPV